MIQRQENLIRMYQMFIIIELFYNYFYFIFKSQLQLFNIMKPYKSNQKTDTLHRRPVEQCKLSWNCPHLLQKRCKLRHDPDDFENADSLDAILRKSKNKEIIVIFDRLSDKSEKKPLCLFDPYLPIRMVQVVDPPMEAGHYYIGIFQEVIDRRVVVKFNKVFGLFGHWAIESRIFKEFCTSYYKLSQKGNNITYRGNVRVNDKDKMLIGDRRKNHHWFLQNVNAFLRYPVMRETQVQYYQQNNRPCLTRITHPREIRLSGIVQIDNNSQFYFISRNTNYDDMNLYSFPKEIEKNLEKFSYLFPYSIHKQSRIDKKDQDEINKILNEILVKGYFKEWLMNCRYPLIELNEDQILERNLKNLKNAIIFEAGIEIKKFSGHEKAEAETISKKFSMNSYKSRPLFCNVLTVDGKYTKCHDDALFIEQLEKGEFMVQIHIADAAELIKKDSKLNKDIKSRDQTIYIKNYYQPMVPEPLKSLLSLKDDKQKLTFTLKFKVNSKGFVDFKSVDFFRSRITVEENLSHQLLSREPQLFPELFKLDELISSSNLVGSNYILQCESKSQMALARLICLSSIIPTYMLDQNIDRSIKLKEQLNEYIKKMVEQKSMAMQRWEDEVTKINTVRKESDKIKKEIKNIDNIIMKELDKLRQQVLRDLKRQQKDLKQETKEKRDKKIREKRPKTGLSSDQDDDSEDESVLVEIVDHEKAQQKKDMDMIDDDIEKQRKQNRVKAIKEVRLNEISSQSESEESVDDDLSEIGTEDAETRMKNAAGGKRYLERIFGVFKIEMKWKNLKEILEAFDTILKGSKSKIYRQYFKRMQIMNRQHFRYIIRIVEEQKNQGKRDQREKKKKEQNYNNLRNSTQNEEKSQSSYSQKVNQKEESSKEQTRKIYRRIDKKDFPQMRDEKPEKNPQKDNKDKELQQKPEKHQHDDLKQVQKAEEKFEISEKISVLAAEKKLQIKNDDQYRKLQKENARKQCWRRYKKQQGNHLNKNQKLKEKYKIELTPEQNDINSKIIENIQNNKDKYFQKFIDKFRNEEQLDISDDQVFRQEQNQTVLQLYRDTKLFFILRLFNKVKEVKSQSIPDQKKDIKQNNKKFPIMQQIEENQEEGREEMELMTHKYLKRDNDKKNYQLPIENQKTESLKGVKPKIDCKVEDSISLIQQINHAEENTEQHQSLDEMHFLLKKYQLHSDPAEDQKEKNQQIKESARALSKKQLRAKVEALIKPFSEEIKLKYSEQKKKLSAKLEQSSNSINQSSKYLKEELAKSQKDYNLIRFLSMSTEEKSEEEEKKIAKPGKKLKKQPKKVKKAKKGAFSDFLQNFEEYAKKANFKFEKMKDKEIDQFLEQKFNVEDICKDENIQEVNREASKIGKDEESLLKWNNPIRSYESLQVMRIIKKYDWLFRGELHPTDVILYHEDIKLLKKQLKELQKYREDKLAAGETNKKAKEANRQIAKLEFYSMMKKDKNVIITFLTITSRPNANYKEVYHPILQEIKVENRKGKFRDEELFKEVQGKVVVKSEFPLEFTAELI